MILRLMMPILPLVRVPNVDEAIDFAVEVERGNRHTALIIKVKAWFIIHFANQKHLVNAINNNTKYLLKFLICNG